MGDSEHAHLALTNPIHGALQFILDHYHEARERDQRLDTSHPLWQTFRTLEQILRGSDPVKRRQPDLAVDWSLGKGNWARIPWIAFLDRRPHARAKMQRRAEKLSQEKYVQALHAAGFLFDNKINLHTEASLGIDYECATIAHKLYPRVGVPLDQVLRQDLEAFSEPMMGISSIGVASKSNLQLNRSKNRPLLLPHSQLLPHQY
jgi:hypothetical protein